MEGKAAVDLWLRFMDPIQEIFPEDGKFPLLAANDNQSWLRQDWSSLSKIRVLSSGPQDPDG